jgi:hypothetical protein
MRPAVSEREFQSQILAFAKLTGWRVAHFRPAKTSKGWRTPVSGDGAGFPDLCLVRPPIVIFAELKSEGGKLRPEQRGWLEALGRCEGAEARVWWPSMWPEIEETLCKRSWTKGTHGERRA